ncbi:glycerophosphoryl diester phosphodiesterase [Enterovibrio calviensis]|uniref:glycerophosphoryl diester phosphodiesterase n=1 Tax=Enterovibrio calviensis TaxID=91359 RepID=UPI000485AE53|nr:glycerophosphoryl diester phosphodiesterase [Enterovibrio calviensis]
MKTLFAHRGMSSLAPENTLSAFALTPKHGLNWIECDVDVLADGTVVISHDDSLDRCTDRPGSLYDLTVDDLADIDAGSWFSDDYIGEPIPTFDQFIDLVNVHKLNVNVEIKSCTAGWAHTERLLDGVVEGLTRLHKDRDLLVSSFNPLALAEFKRRCPDIAVACLFSKEALEDDWLSIMQACQADTIHVEDEGLTKEKVIEMKGQGFTVNVYTVNQLGRANQLFNWGVDGVFTDVGHTFPSRYRNG